MPGVKVDRRTRRTQRLIAEALIALMQETRYDRITVQEIIDRADVGRSTFYAHFRDKDDVLTNSFDRVIDTLGWSTDADDAPGERFVPSLALFRHTGENHTLYRALYRGHGVDLIFEAVHRNLRVRAERELAALAKQRGEPPVPVPILADYLVGTFLSLLRWWLDERMPHPPERMEDIYRQLVMPSLRAIVGDTADLLPRDPAP